MRYLTPVPLLSSSTYQPPRLLRNGHLLSVWPSVVRRVSDVAYSRERITTPDGDFLDLDWSLAESRAGGGNDLVIISHGLEGASERSYMRGMARAMNRAGRDALCWNYRGCSGEPNRLLRSYHSGATDDLEVVIRHALDTKGYRRVALVGFSLGGNITLKYLGERGPSVDPAITRAVAFSVPCDLRSSSMALARPTNSIYMRRFLVSLRAKMLAKESLMAAPIDHEELRRMRTFQEFDDRFTAPLHGFRDAEDYWRQSSSRQFLGGITIPTLLVNALDDPFLDTPCYPYEEARQSNHLWLETPHHGGHVGFVSFASNGEYWSEQRAVEHLSLISN